MITLHSFLGLKTGRTTLTGPSLCLICDAGSALVDAMERWKGCFEAVAGAEVVPAAAWLFDEMMAE